MSCTDVASVLDSHRMAHLGPAERAQIDAHLAACADCTAAWHAQAELAALRVPAMPATLLERALLASRLPQSAPARRARLSVVVGSVLLAGAAAAAVTFVSLRDEAAPVPSTTETSPSAAATATDPALEEPLTAAAPSAPQGDGVTSVELIEVALGVQPVVRTPPEYPPEALEAGLEGHVQLKFDVTAAGIVENISIVESSDALFEEPAARALAEWRYLPRIAAGARAGSQGIHTILRFALNRDPAPVALRTVRPDNDYAAFNLGLEVAMNRLAADDLRGVELQLDELQALYGAGRADLWNFYGYLYTVQGDYGRAIDAYERSVGIAMQSPAPGSGPYTALANLYFARHQYDVALRTLLRPRQASNGTLPRGGTRLSPDAELLIDRLRALGVTEETL